MPREIRIPDRSEVTDDTPMLLHVTARLAFPDGTAQGQPCATRLRAGAGDRANQRIDEATLEQLSDLAVGLATRIIERKQ